MKKNGFADAVKSFLNGRAFYFVLLGATVLIGTITYIAVKSRFTVPEVPPINIDKPYEPEVPSVLVPDETGIPESETWLPPEEEVIAEDEPPAEPVQTPDPEPAKEVMNPVQPELRYMMPAGGVVAKEFSVDVPVFSPTMGDYRAHMGVDIAAAVGTPVKACADGEIIEVYTDDLMGVIVKIKHTDGVISVYCGLQGELAAETAVGATVKCGTVIGGVGQTALAEVSDPPHLHFELIKDGVNIDPMEKLPE